jgi:hypothetical protein
MSDLTDRLRNPTINLGTTTHSDVCWQWHDPCAAVRAADLIDAIEVLCRFDSSTLARDINRLIHPEVVA